MKNSFGDHKNMRTSHATGFKFPKLALYVASALGATACSTSNPIEPTYNGPPVVTSVFFEDSVYGTLPDVLTYSSSSSANKTAAPPPSYGKIRIEFDRPLAIDGTVVSKNNLSSGSYCSPLTTAAVQLLDLAGGAATPVAASVCYDPTGDIGHGPGFVIVPGSGALAGSATSPFTCNAFGADQGDDNGNIFLPKHNYGVKLTAASMKDHSGAAVSLPSTWSGGTYAFTTDGFSLMAFGFQDQTNQLYHWFYKGSPGFENGLLAATIPVCSTNSDTTKCTNPAFDTNLLFYFSSPIGAGDGDVTVTRDDATNSSLDGYAAIGNFSGDPRELAVAPGLFWESNGKYKITLPSTIASVDGTAIAAADAKVYSFTTIPAPAEVLAFAPAANTTGVAYSAVVNLLYQEPINPSLVSATSTSFQILKGSSPIPATVAFIGGTDHQYVRITPTPPTVVIGSPTTYALDPETTYTVRVTGLTVEPGTPNAGAKITDFTSTFTTATFRSNLLATSSSGTTNIDRTSTQQPTVLRTGVYVRFTNVPTAATITADNIKLSELNPDGKGGITSVALDSTQYSVAVSGSRALIKTIGAYSLKYGQRYQVKMGTGITDAVSGKSLKAEGCVSSDCSDSLAFRTAVFAPSITAPSAKADKLIGKFTLTFNVGAQAASLAAQPPTAYQLFKQKLDTDGVTFINDGAAIPATCATIVDGAASTACQTAVTLDANTRYLISVIFAQSTPLKAADTIGGVATDTASNQFYGIRTLAFVTPCP